MAYTGRRTDLQTTAFGDWDVANPTLQAQLNFVYNVNSYETATILTGSGTVTSSQPFALVQSGAASSSNASLSSEDSIPYRNGQGGLILFGAIYGSAVAGNTQVAGAGGTVNGLFFGYNGTVFAINRRSNGVDNWVVQNSWNVDPMNGTGASGMTLNPRLGNAYKIQYQWLGFGNISYFVENPTTGQFVRVHTIQYPNSATVTSLLQPSMSLYLSSANTTNTTNISIQCSSMAGFCEGFVNDLGNIFSFRNTKAVGSAEIAVFNLRNNTTFNSIVNRKTINLLNMSLYIAGTSAGVFNVWWGTSIGGAAAFTNLNSQVSCASLDTSPAIVVRGSASLLASFAIPAASSKQIDLSFLTRDINPGEIVSFTASGSVLNPNCGISVIWSEKY